MTRNNFAKILKQNCTQQWYAVASNNSLKFGEEIWCLINSRVGQPPRSMFSTCVVFSTKCSSRMYGNKLLLRTGIHRRTSVQNKTTLFTKFHSNKVLSSLYCLDTWPHSFVRSTAALHWGTDKHCSEPWPRISSDTRKPIYFVDRQ